MKENIYDRALEKVLLRIDKATDRIAFQFKGVQPFNKEPVDKKELLRSYESLSTSDMVKLIERHGVEKVGDFIKDMETTKQRRSKNGRTL